MLFVWPLLTVLSDLLILATSGILAYYTRYHTALAEWVPPPFGTLPPLEYYITSAIIASLFWVTYMLFNGVYRQKWWVMFLRELMQTYKAFLQGFAVLFALVFFYRDFSYSRVVAVITLLYAIILLLANRTFLYKLRRLIFSRRPPHKVLLIGDRIEMLYQRFSSIPQTGMLITGWLADEENGNEFFEKIITTVQKESIDTVVLSYNFNRFNRAREIIDALEEYHLDFNYVPDLAGVVTSSLRSYSISGIPVLQLRSDPMSGWNGIIKRSFDLIFSLALFLLLSPLMVLIGLLIVLTSRGNIIYRQQRVSLDGKLFTIYKFRSMTAGAEKGTGPVWAQKDDSRTTTIGRFLRRWSLDELPQLWNVIKGDMSLVGPRPERPHFVEQFKESIPRYAIRHHVRCGLTGWAQVNGLRGQTPIEERTKYDLFYIENWSLGFDIRIIFSTIAAVISGKDAY